MFGMEKDKGRALVEFDLEQELKKDPAKAKKTLEQVQAKITEIKEMLREGSKSEEFEQLGVVLHGYTALERVLKGIHK